MDRESTVLKWEVLLDDTKWGRKESLDELLNGQPAQAAQRRRRLSHLWTAVLAALLLVGCGSYWAWREAQSGLATSNGELASAVEAEAWRGRAVGQADNDTTEASPSGTVSNPANSESPQSGATRVEMGDVALRTGLAMVEVTTTDATSNAYRETHFYTEEPGLGWQRTTPDARFWGHEQIVETTYFRFRYRTKDAEAVEEVAARLDTIYTQLSADVGLPPMLDKLEIAVLPVSPEKIGLLEFREGRLNVMSPKLLAVPVEMSDGAALLKSVAHPLAAYVMREAMEFNALRYQRRYQWDAMRRGLQLWQTYNLPHNSSSEAGSDIQKEWYRETVTWLYDDAPALYSRKQDPSTDDLRILCREYYTWRHSLLVELALPTLCTSTYWEAMIRNYLIAAPDRLDSLLYDAEMYSHPEAWLIDWVQVLMAATVIDYLVETYGRDHLPTLLYGFSAHGDWETLVPAMLDISAEEFEAGWQAYLQETAQRATARQP